MKRTLAAWMLGISLLCSSSCPAMASEILAESVTELRTGSIGGEWAVIALSRSDTELPEGCYEAYLDSVEEKLVECDGVLDTRKYTEYSRVALGLAALGEDPQNFRGWDVLEPLKDLDKVSFQGSNGPIWALIAVDSNDYEGFEETREQLLDKVVDLANEDGGYGLITGNGSDPDLTAMAMTALAAHQEDPEAEDAIQKGMEYLTVQMEEGFESCESWAQTLLACASLNLQEEAELCRDELELYAVDGGYCHLLEEGEINGMATEQALYSIAAYERMQKGENRLFDMRDVSCAGE